MRNKTLKRFGAAFLAATMVLSNFGSVSLVQAAEETSQEEYEIYPTPHEMEYGEDSWLLRSSALVTYESGIDDATKARLEETLALKNMTISEDSQSKTGKTEILVGIYGSGETVDDYVEENYEVSADLFEKTDSYFLASDDNTIVVLGANTDAAYYGLTSLYHIFAQMESREIRNFEMRDWADVVSRGFIEGYYGNPWSVEDRENLMTWGGYYKLNSYFYAPKDDPKHNSNWRALYTQEELDTLIKPLAEAGNASKCRFVYALHPFMYNAISFSSDAAYQADLEIVQAKFEQVISAGVRQIAILADDANNVGSANYIKFLNDMTEWLAEMQEEYPDLKQTLPFCTVEYMGTGESYYAQFPENVQIVMTGGRVWGEVSNSFTTTFTNNAGRGPYMWVNWPCTDNSKNHLIMGGHKTFLQAGVDPSNIQGIVLNPMQQSEPSKVAIFCNAAYSWNIWETDEEADLAWENSFKYVDHNSAIETKSSDALKELSKHMINQNMDSRVTALDESENIKDALSAFRTNLSTGAVTKAECDELIAVFEELQNAAEVYTTNPGSEAVRDQIIYWLECWADTTEAAIAYLEAVKADIDGNSNVLITKYNEGKVAFANSKSHGFDYMGTTQYAEVGVQHIVPFISAMEEYVSAKASLVLDPEAIMQTFITSRTDTPTGDKADIFDGNYTSGVIYKTPNSIYEGDYVGVLFSKVINIKNVRFVLGAGKDHFDEAKIQYTLDGSEWIDLSETTYAGVQNQVQDIALTEDELPENFQAMGVRLIATTDNAKDAWLEVREVEVNKGVESTGSSDINYNVIKSSAWEIYQGSESSLYDGDDSTYVWYDPNGGSGDSAVVGDYLGYDFGEVLNLQSIHAVIGNSGTDKLLKYNIEVSVDGENWDVVKACTGAETGMDTVDIELNGVQAQYVRIRNTELRNYWIKFSELTVELVSEADGSYVYANVSDELLSERSGNVISLLGGEVTLDEGKYVGVKLPNIRRVEDIDVSDLADGLVLQTSKNTIEWEDYKGGTVDARYVRVVNNGSSSVTWIYDTFDVTFYEVGEYKVSSDFANGSTSRDVRSLGNVANVFDGDLTTYAEVTGSQVAGKVVVFDLGRTIDFETIRYYISESNMDYPRSMVLEVADSEDADEWTTVLTIKKEGFENTADTTTAKDMQDNGLYHDNMNPGYMYAEATDLNVSGRYLRARIVDSYDGRWLAFNEIQINGGEYTSMEDGRDVVSEDIEVPYMVPSNMLDGDFSTSYMSSAENSSFTYYLSEPVGVKSVRIVQLGTITNAKVTAGFTDGTAELGTLCQSVNEFNVPDGKTLLSVTVSWTDAVPEIAEILTFKTKEDAGDVISAIEALLKESVDAASWTASTKADYENAKATAQSAVSNEYISRAMAESILNTLSSAIENGKVRYTSDALAKAVEEAVSNENGTYTDASYRKYADVLTDVQKALENADELTEEEGNALYEELCAAKDALVYSKVNGQLAQLLVEEIEALDENDYTEEQWAAIQDAKEAIEAKLAEEADGSKVNPDEYAELIKAAEKAIAGEVDVVTNPFTDINDTQYYYDPILWAVGKNITQGTSDTTFSPEVMCTRGQVVTFLWRAAGEPEPTVTANKFTDVKESDYYYKAILWAVEKGITDGTGDTTFSPEDFCTRGQGVTFLYRYAEQPDIANKENKFTDITTADYYYNPILWAVEKGITDGTGDTTFSPKDMCTRGQVVTFLYRLCK